MTKKQVLKFYPDEKAINVFTDGSAFQVPGQKNGPRRGGIGIVVVTVNSETYEDEVEKHPMGGYLNVTNNMMELKAAIEGLKIALDHPKLDKVDKIIIVSDSMYVTNNYEAALHQWSQNQWMNQHDKPVDNAELWSELVKLINKAKKRVKFQWVRSHSASTPYNAMADELAKQSANEVLGRRYLNKSGGVRRKTSKERTIPGSVRLSGQKLKIRIVEAQWKNLSKVHKYRYQVLSEESPDFDRLDIAHSRKDLNLKEGHHYQVVFNSDQKNPQIIEVIEELER